MDYTIQQSQDKHFLVMKAMCDINIDVARRWTADLDRRSRETDVRWLLIDVRSVRNLCSVLENYNFAYHDLYDIGVRRNVAVAILVSEGDHSHDFVETALRNAGISARLFTDEQPAVNWLEAGRDLAGSGGRREG